MTSEKPDSVNILVVNRPPRDFPAKELRKSLSEHISNGRSVHPKFTCTHCHERVFAVDVVNELPSIMICPKCGGEHDFEKFGGNYALGQKLNTNSPLTNEQAFTVWRKSNNQ